MVMWVLFCLLFVGTTTKSVETSTRNIEFTDGLTYVYKYSGKVTSAIPTFGDEEVGSDILTDVIIQPSKSGFFSIQLQNIQLKHLNSSEYEKGSDIDSGRKILEIPLHFKHESGKVESLESDTRDTKWSLDIKKSILMLFNVNLSPSNIIRETGQNRMPKPIDFQGLTYFGVYEQSLVGVCETVYHVNENKQNQTLNVTKVYNYANCLTESRIISENIGATSCSCNKQTSQPIINGYYPVGSNCPCHRGIVQQLPLDQFNSIKFNISSIGSAFSVDSAVGNGKIVYTIQGEKIVVSTHQYIKLNQTKPFTENKSKNLGTLIKQGLEFQLPLPERQRIVNIPVSNVILGENMELNVQGTITEIQRLITKLADAIKSDNLSGNNNAKDIENLNLLLSVLSEEQLKMVYHKVTSEKLAKNLFMDSLAIAGTNEAIHFGLELIQSNNLRPSEAVDFLTSVPTNMYRPTPNIINIFTEMCLEPEKDKNRDVFTAACISLAKLVRKGCLYHPQERLVALTSNTFQVKPVGQELCSKEQAIEIVRSLSTKLAITESFNDYITYIETLAHVGLLESLAVIQPLISGTRRPDWTSKSDEKYKYLRVAAIYSLYHLVKQYPEHVSAVLLPIYSNTEEDARIRVAAFSNIMQTNPPIQRLAAIAIQLNREPSQVVRSYVISTLRSMVHLELPKFRMLSRKIRRIVGFLPKDNPKQSTTIMADYFDRLKRSGLWSHVEQVYKGENVIPAASYVGLGLQDNYSIQENIIEFAFTRQSVKQQEEDENIKDEKTKAEDENQDLKAITYMKLFGQTVFKTWDKQTIVQFSQGLKTSIENRSSNNTQNEAIFVKMCDPITVESVLSSEVGAPILFRHSKPTLGVVKVTDFEMKNNSFSATVKTQLTHYNVVDMSIRQRSVFGSVLQQKTSLSLTMEISIDLESKKLQVSFSQGELMRKKLRGSVYTKKAALVPSEVVSHEIKQQKTQQEQSTEGKQPAVESLNEVINSMKEQSTSFDSKLNKSSVAFKNLVQKVISGDEQEIVVPLQEPIQCEIKLVNMKLEARC